MIESENEGGTSCWKSGRHPSLHSVQTACAQGKAQAEEGRREVWDFHSRVKHTMLNQVCWWLSMKEAAEGGGPGEGGGGGKGGGGGVLRSSDLGED